MTESARHLHVVDRDSGEVLDGCPDCKSLEMELRAKRAQITRLKNENARLMGVEPEHEIVQEVLAYACKLLMPNATIVPGSKRWMAVRARLKEGFDPLQLRAAACGAVMDGWTMDASQRHRRDPEHVFSDAGKVDRLIQDAVGFKGRTGVSALTLVDELGGPALSFLADRCSCGGLRVAHLMGNACAEFDEFAARVNRHLSEVA